MGSNRPLLWSLMLAMAPVLCACANGTQRDASRRAEVTAGLKTYLLTQVTTWLEASQALQQAAPTPPERGWDQDADAEAVARMREAWARGRHAYELIEGAIAPIFPESDVATDARYDDHLLLLGARGDSDAFDDEGVVGMHAIERILWADAIPHEVLDHEKSLLGYHPARMPQTPEEASAFKDKLAARMVADVTKLRDELVPLELDLAFAYRGLIDLVREQVEKVDKAATGEEESRYAQATMRDVRANLQGCEDVWALFRPWLLERPGGKDKEARIAAGFARLRALYAQVPEDRMPRPPESWTSLDPRAADLATPFGKLHTAVTRETDDTMPSSLLSALLDAGRTLNLPEVLK